MRFTLRLSPSLTSAGDPRFRFRFLLFDVRMCRMCDRPRFTFPVPVNLKRLAAPLCVFSFGIKILRKQPSALSHQLSVSVLSRRMSEDRSGETFQLKQLVIPTLSKGKARNLLLPTTRAW